MNRITKNSLITNFILARKYLFLLPVLLVLIIKIPHLSVPYFWDEAWSYFPAVYKMYQTGPGLLPGDLPIGDSKGHPLFFFFISSLWMKITGTSVFFVHLLPLFISLGVLVKVYFMVKQHANEWAAILATSLISIQSLFLAQATMLLPEMMVTLLLLFSLDAYLKKKYFLFSLYSALLILTKETSIVYMAGFLVFHTMRYLKPVKESRKYITEMLIFMIPVAIYGLFLILHKAKFGSFFYGDHLGYINLEWSYVKNMLEVAFRMIFRSYGRIIITIAALVSIVITLIRYKKILHNPIIILLLILIIFFVVFSALNFYTQRYMLSVMVLFIIGSAILIQQARFKNNLVNLMLAGVIIGVPLFYSLTKKTNTDNDLGYVDVVKVHQEMVTYCENEGWHDKPIAAGFNLIFCLRDPQLGYLSGNKSFSNVKDLRHSKNAEVVLNDCTNYDYSEQLDSVKVRLHLVERITIDQAWGEIYTDDKPH